MNMAYRLYHNPRCSKSRQALALLEIREIEFEEYRYLDLGIKPEDLAIIGKLKDIIRIGEAEYKTSPIDLENLQEVSALLQTSPTLCQRPILIANGKAIIGRPPEKILTLLLEA
jgi:arsenate reductase